MYLDYMYDIVHHFLLLQVSIEHKPENVYALLLTLHYL